MRIFLIRHGAREHDGTSEDKNMPLSNGGKDEVRRLGPALARLDLRPEVYLTSYYRHAIETGNILTAQLNDTSPVRILNLCALTPKSPTETFEDIIDEAISAGLALRTLKVVAVVGHEARLSQLLTRLTSARARPFNRAEVACLTANSFVDFLQGRGKVEFRLPVVDYQEDQLRPKVQSKMTVSTFLAGFTFTALIEILSGTEKTLAPLQVVAAISLTAALALFVAAVYVYDQLGMPEGFWVYGDRPTFRRVWIKKFAKQFEEDRCHHGILYAYLVWTWGWVFSPAVGLGLLGFVAILFNTKDVWVITGGFVVVIAVGMYYLATRPELGTDERNIIPCTV